MIHVRFKTVFSKFPEFDWDGFDYLRIAIHVPLVIGFEEIERTDWSDGRRTSLFNITWTVDGMSWVSSHCGYLNFMFFVQLCLEIEQALERSTHAKGHHSN